MSHREPDWRLTSIDPGTKALGAAHWRHGRLHRVGVSITPCRSLSDQIKAHRHRIGPLYRADQVVVEEMRYRPNDARSQPQDLLSVQAVGCAVGAHLGPLILLPASEWKGSIPKHIHHARIVDVLNPVELRILEDELRYVPKGNRKEALDAVGIGLYYLRRTNRSGGART